MAVNYPSPCLDLSGVPTGKPPISVLRLGKDAMAFRSGEVVSTYMSDYIPSTIMPGYNGHMPCMSNAFGNTVGNTSKNILLAYRNEILSKTARPKYFYGRLPTNFIPLPDVALAEKVIQWRSLYENPNIRPISMDGCRHAEIGRFHTQAQAQRDFYLDKSEKVLPVSFFDVGEPWPVRCPADERTFKIKRFQDSCDVPGWVGPPLRCGGMPCIKHRSLMRAFKPPTVPRLPFRCGEVKTKDPLEHDILHI